LAKGEKEGVLKGWEKGLILVYLRTQSKARKNDWKVGFYLLRLKRW